MTKEQGPSPQHRNETQPNAEAYRELDRELFRLCDPGILESDRILRENILDQLVSNSPALIHARDFLLPGGMGYQRDPEVADTVREKLAWQLVGRLTQIKGRAT